MTRYRVKKIFHSIQGEGLYSGHPAVFVRFSGCNLWNGRESGRVSGVGSCSLWCDSDFLGGVSMSSEEISIECLSDNPGAQKRVVLTGGEPSLQVDDELVGSLRESGLTVAMETNGTNKTADVDWLTFSPKRGADVKIESCDEIKIVYPTEIYPLDYDDFPAKFRYVSPKNNTKENMMECLSFCVKHPSWAMTTQLQKTLGIE